MTTDLIARQNARIIVDEGSAVTATAAQARRRIVVIGGGQAGLSVGYHLKRLGIDDFVILDASRRIGDAWRNRWDSLKLFTPRIYDGLDGMPLAGTRYDGPGKDEMADYLEAYAKRFALPVRLNTRVTRLGRSGGGFVVETADGRLAADQVIVAMSNYQAPRRPGFAAALAPHIRQFDAATYRNPGQMAEGDVLIVGAANSGAEIAKDLAATHRVLVAGPTVPEIPGRYASWFNKYALVHILMGFVFPHVMSVDTPIGRRARADVLKRAVPLIRVKSRDLAALGIRRAGRITGVRDGLPLLEDGTTIEVANVVWCSGYGAGLEWIDLPVLLPNGEPDHDRGAARSVPGLYFVGQHFLTSMASSMVHGVGRDAARIAALVAR